MDVFEEMRLELNSMKQTLDEWSEVQKDKMMAKRKEHYALLQEEKGRQSSKYIILCRIN